MKDTHVLTVQVAVDLTQVLDQDKINGVMFVLGCKSEDEIIQKYGEHLTQRVDNALGFRPDCRIVSAQLDPVDMERAVEPEGHYEQPVSNVVAEEDELDEESYSYHSEANSEPEVAKAIQVILHDTDKTSDAIDFSKAPFSMVNVTEPDPYPNLEEFDETGFIQSLTEALAESLMMKGEIVEVQVLRSENVPYDEVVEVVEAAGLDDAIITYTHEFEETEDPQDPITFRIVLDTGSEQNTTIVGYGRYNN